MDPDVKHIISRRVPLIDEVFNLYLNCNGSKMLSKTLKPDVWEHRLITDISNHIMTESLNMDAFIVWLSKTDEMKKIHSGLYEYIKNKYGKSIRGRYTTNRYIILR